ncbi:toxin-antitoxin system, toxin component [Streptomyces sp. NPDC058145]|uniref:toxin-antitoxin system, toxin component n=1 Tax=Streptomyces sp. NPDC058145 TaxID=3346356 RepID=UPI0036EE2F09
MSTGPKAMRRLSARLIKNMRQLAGDEDVIPLIGEALSQVRGRTVRLRKAAFPPMTASGLWVDRTRHDLIVYEQNTEPEHQLVIIGHEAWHMFQGHCNHAITHGPAASRALPSEETADLARLVAAVSDADDAYMPLTDRTDASLHYAARSDTRTVDEELQAEHFGMRLATHLQMALLQARSSAHPQEVSGRIGASMAHRFAQS